jgi:hypothetical protein
MLIAMLKAAAADFAPHDFAQAASFLGGYGSRPVQ